MSDMTWAELAALLRAMPGCDSARVQNVWPASAGLYDAAPVTVAVYATPDPARADWLVHVTAIDAGGRARCNLLAGFRGETAAAAALIAATKAIYS